MQTLQKQELNEVFLLRGAASLMVCLFHLILGNEGLFPSSNVFEQVFSFGYLGVEVFFILSGYVICYSLPSSFGTAHLKTFFFKRILRIEPPYVVSILLVLVLNYLSHALTGLPDHVDLLAVLGHLAYINNFNTSTYVNVVYWTLGIEFQFYILIGLLFPFINFSKYTIAAFSLLFIGLSCLPIPSGISVILPVLSYFTIGILFFFYKKKTRLSRWLFGPLILLCISQVYFFQGAPGAIAAAGAILVLLYCTYTNRIIKFFSAISFSLYLIHVPVGGKVINLGMRFAHTDLSRYALVLLALAVSVATAYLFYKIVELPAMKLSKRLVYSPAVNRYYRVDGRLREETVQPCSTAESAKA